MRTGRNVTEPEEEVDTQFQAALLVFLEEAAVLAMRYAAYRGCSDAEPEHLVACLKVHAQRGIAGLCRLHNADARLAEYADLQDAEDSDVPHGKVAHM